MTLGQAAPEAIRAVYGPFFGLNQGAPRMQADERTSSGRAGLRQHWRCVIRSATERAAGPSGRLFSYFARDLTMKPDIHPNYHMIKVVMTNGVEFMTRSTYGEDGATLHLDIDPNTHPAWTGGSQQLTDRGGRLSRFNSRFAGLGAITKKKGGQRAPDRAAAAKVGGVRITPVGLNPSRESSKILRPIPPP